MNETTDPNLNGAFIPISSIYQTLLELRYDVRDMAAKLDRNAEAAADHERRIRDLERWKYAISAALISSVTALAAEIIRLINP